MKILPKQFSLEVLFVKNFLLSVLLAGLLFSQQVFAVDADEQEANQPIAMAQFVTPGMAEYEVSGVVGNLSGSVVHDVDFYKFFGQKGDVVTLDIDGGWGGARSVDTRLTVFGEGPAFTRLDTNDDAPVDEGSSSRRDSRIENMTLPSSGVYYVVVSHYRVRFSSGGNSSGSTSQNGDYKLVISGVTGAPAVLHFNIDVKPGTDPDQLAPLNPKSRGRVPVALLSKEGFDPANVNVKTLTFGHDGDEDSLAKCNKPSVDLNKDGVKDMICHFDNQIASFRKGDEAGLLKGELNDGTAIAGRGLLKVLPEKAD